MHEVLTSLVTASPGDEFLWKITYFSFESLQRAIHGKRGDGRLDVLMGKFTTKEGTATGLEVPFQAMEEQLWSGGPLGFYICFGPRERHKRQEWVRDSGFFFFLCVCVVLFWGDVRRVHTVHTSASCMVASRGGRMT